MDSVEAHLRELLLRGLAGEQAAYRDFLEGVSTHLRAFLRRRLARLPDFVEDLVQESLFAIHKQRHTYDPGQPLTPWLYALARYKLVDFLRRERRGDLLNEPLQDHEDLLAGSDDAASEAQRDVRQLLCGLPERQRLAIVHVKLEGLSVAQTARLTGMSESAVKVGVHRGLKSLAAKFGAHRR